MQQMKVLPEELLVHLGSYPRGANGDECVEAAEKRVHKRWAASVRATTRVKPEQASKGIMSASSLSGFGEDRRDGDHVTNLAHLPTGVMGVARTHALSGNTGDLRVVQVNLHAAEEAKCPQESEGLVVPMKLVNASGGKGPWFRVRLGEPRVRRST